MGLFDEVPMLDRGATAGAKPAPRSLFDAVPMVESVAPAPAETDPIRAQVRREVDESRARGVDTSAGLARRVVQGATFNLADEVLAAAGTIPEMIRRRTLSPAEGYAYAKAREDIDLDDGRKAGGLAGHGAELVGGIGSGLGLMARGATMLPRARAALGSGVPGTAAGLAADGAIIGGISGAADENGTDRLSGGATGAAVGGAIGGAVPIAGAVVGMGAAPVVSNIRARTNPAGYAERQVGRAAAESGASPAEIADRLARAGADGQPEYRLMDAMGLPGQRMAATVPVPSASHARPDRGATHATDGCR